MDKWHARLFMYRDGRLARAADVETERAAVDASDVGAPSRVSTRSGTRGMTRTDYAKRMWDEGSRRQRKHVVEAILAVAGDAAGVALAGMSKTVAAARRDLEDKLSGRMVEVPEVSLDSTDVVLAAAAARAASELTTLRQARVLEACRQVPERGCLGWNRTYRALAAGAVDTLLVSRHLIEDSPDDAERLVRLALAQGAEVEEVGDEIGASLWADADGVAARLRFRIAA
jgi:peptide subunit release factor 1 (eRF1)